MITGDYEVTAGPKVDGQPDRRHSDQRGRVRRHERDERQMAKVDGIGVIAPRPPQSTRYDW